MSEQRKILDMLAAGQISAEQAEKLLSALGGSSGPQFGEEFPFGKPARPRSPVKLLRIHIDAEDEARVNVNVPIALAKFATQFIPKEARGELEVQGIDLGALIDSLGDELPEGRLVDIEANEDKNGERKVKIVIEVV